MAAEPAPRRHDLVRPTGAAWEALLRGGHATAGVHAALLARGAACGWPLVARRRMPSDPPARVPVGLKLPPSAGKVLLAWTVAARDIERIDPPPSLQAARASAPRSWQPTVSRLLRIGAAVGTVPRLFGSLAWACLTGLDHVGPGSDLDLLWHLGPGQDPAPLLRALLALAARAPMRLDGEVVLEDGRAVSWRELASGAPEVLVKTVAGVALVGRGALLAGALRP